MVWPGFSLLRLSHVFFHRGLVFLRFDTSADQSASAPLFLHIHMFSFNESVKTVIFKFLKWLDFHSSRVLYHFFVFEFLQLIRQRFYYRRRILFSSIQTLIWHIQLHQLRFRTHKFQLSTLWWLISVNEYLLQNHRRMDQIGIRLLGHFKVIVDIVFTHMDAIFGHSLLFVFLVRQHRRNIKSLLAWVQKKTASYVLCLIHILHFSIVLFIWTLVVSILAPFDE